MASKALSDLLTGIDETGSLLEADPAPKNSLSPRPEITRAVIRSAVVILTSHFERYIYAITEEAVIYVEQCSVKRDLLETKLRLQHTRVGLDEVVGINWENREERLSELIDSDGWLWRDLPPTLLDHERLLRWMKSPNPKSVIRAYRLWGIDNVFAGITRKSSTRDRYFLHIKELVEKRNNIAHGDFTAESTRGDVTEYKRTVQHFCERADSLFARTLASKLKVARPW